MVGSDSDLFSWFTSRGGTYDALCTGITIFPGHGGRGAVALKDISKDHTLFEIPRGLTLSMRTSELPKLFGVPSWKKAGLTKGWAGLILCMMWEESRGSESRWDVYLASMPTAFDTPMFWNDIDLRELQGTGVVEKIGRNDVERDYIQKVVPAIQSRPDLFKHELLDIHYTLERYHIMGSRILSRSFHVEKWEGGDEDIPIEEKEEANSNSMEIDSPVKAEKDAEDEDVPNEEQEQVEGNDGDEADDEDGEDPSDVAMVPIADILNARYGTENAKLFYEERSLKMVTTKPIAAGEQIWNTYGDPPNSDLLRRYGHTDLIELPQGGLGNPADIVEVRADLIVSIACPYQEEFVKERIDWWLEEGGDDIFVLDMDFDIPDTVVSFVRLMSLAPPEWEKARNKGKPPKPKVDQSVLDIISRTLAKRLEEYPTTIEDDESTLSSELGNLPLNKKHAVVVRLGEKRILTNVLGKVKELQEQEKRIEQSKQATTPQRSKRKGESEVKDGEKKKARR